MTEASRRDRYLAPGTRVTLRSLEEGAPEHGVVIHCWGNDEIDAWDCYVAFFGDEMPLREPASKPYVLRYAASSLKVAEPSPHALLLRDTLVDLREHLKEVEADTEFGKGYSRSQSGVRRATNFWGSSGISLDFHRNPCRNEQGSESPRLGRVGR